MKYLKLFDNHAEYEGFVSGETMVRPNVSHCVQENDIHYNTKPYTLTPKQLAEYTHSFLMSTNEKFFMHRQEHMEEEGYGNICERKMGHQISNLRTEKNLQYRNIQLGIYTGDLIYANNEQEIFNFGIAQDLRLTNLRFDYNDMFVEGKCLLYKTNEIYNGNDVFYISYYEVIGGDDDGTVEDLVYQNDNLLYGDNIVLLSPHNAYSNFTIAYPDGNGGYTTTKPATFELTPSIENEMFYANPDWIFLILFHSQDQEINTRVDNAIATLRSDFRNWLNGDFSALSVLDDIKMEVPKDIYKIIKNPWTYLDEEYIFDGQLPSNP